MTDKTGQQAPRRSARPTSTSAAPRRVTLVVCTVAVAVAVIWWGADRRPADNSTPPQLIGKSRTSPLDRRTLSIATFNIHRGKGLDGRTDLDRTAESIGQFDIVGLNEVKGAFDRNENQAAILGRRLTMASLFAPTERRWWHDHFGNGLLTRVPLADCRVIPLPGTRGKGFRNVILAQIMHQDEKIQIMVTHVDNQDDRQAQLKMVVDLFLSLRPPAILMGDLNARAGDPQIERLAQYEDMAVNQTALDVASEHTDLIDWIFARGMDFVRGGMAPADASDHPLIWAEFRIR